MSIKQYLKDMKNIHKCLLDFIEQPEKKEKEYQNLLNLLEEKQILTDKHMEISFLYMIQKIFYYHSRSSGLLSKLNDILIFLKDSINKNFANYELPKGIKNNSFISSVIFPGKEAIQDDKKSDDDENRIYSLIQDDSLQEFIDQIHQSSISIIDATIPQKISDSFFFFKNQLKITLIEFAAAFGSVEIFKYLMSNGAKLSKRLWIHAIYGNNIEIIQILNQEKIEPDDTTFCECLLLSIQCNHNNIARFIQKSLYKKNQSNEGKILEQCLGSYNFEFIQNDQIDQNSLALLCKYDYFILVNLLLNDKNIDVNKQYIRLEFDIQLFQC